MRYSTKLPAAFFAAALALAAGCAGADDRSTLKLAMETEPTTFDPALAVDYSSGLVVSLIHANLVRFDYEGKIVPDAATSWDVDESGCQYTFRLGSSRFSSGEPVRAADVVHSFRRLLDPATASPRWWVLEPVRGAAGYHAGGPFDEASLSAPDDSTVEVILERPVAHFLSLLTMPAASIVAAEAASDRVRDYGRDPCGSGPWILERYIEGEEIVLRRNPNGNRVNEALSTISLRIIPEPMTRIAEFEVGNLDVLRVPRAELEIWKAAGARLFEQEELSVTYIGLNCTRPPLSDPRVRRALNYAVDVEAIIAKVLFGAGVRACGTVPPSLKGGVRSDDRYAYDPARARGLLTEAGYPEGFGMEIWQRENPEGGRILESVQGYLAAVGIEVRIETREWGVFKQAVDKGTPDAFYLDWYADYPDAENFLFPLFHSSNRGGGGNRTGYSRGEVDSLLTAASLESDPVRRLGLYEEAEKMVYDDAPWLFLWFQLQFDVVSYRLEGYRMPVIFSGQKYLDVRFH